eukprot:m.555406 g.555406  ORF g.555406 m.555406 type:complete len:52 (-) comp22181_c0_seq32:451-606(-)
MFLLVLLVSQWCLSDTCTCTCQDHMVAALNAATSLDDHTKDSVIASLECIY